MVVPLNFGWGPCLGGEEWKRREEVGWWDGPMIRHQTESHSDHQLAVNSPYPCAWHMLSAQLIGYLLCLDAMYHPPRRLCVVPGSVPTQPGCRVLEGGNL